MDISDPSTQINQVAPILQERDELLTQLEEERKKVSTLDDEISQIKESLVERMKEQEDQMRQLEVENRMLRESAEQKRPNKRSNQKLTASSFSNGSKDKKVWH